LSARLHPQGHDDLAQLGYALEARVERRAASAAQEDQHAEFVESMQLAETEEPHDLLKRHVERSAQGSSVVVLNRNNSADRLEAKTILPDDSPLLQSLAAPNRALECLAMRSARTHQRDPDLDKLVLCEVCGVSPQCAICEPLLVSGEVSARSWSTIPSRSTQTNSARSKKA
jgi:hypothetical protein